MSTAEVGTVMASSEPITKSPEEVIINFLEAMDKDGGSHKGLDEAFKILEQGNVPVSADVLLRAMIKSSVKLTTEYVEEIIRQVKEEKKDGEKINCEDFIEIVK